MNPSEKIRFRCPGCDNPVAAPASKTGVRMRCPKCKEVVTVPAATEPGSTAPPSFVEATDREPEPVSRPGPGMLLRGEWLLFRCPSCHTWTKVRRANFNQNVACGVCATEFFLELEG